MARNSERRWRLTSVPANLAFIFAVGAHAPFVEGASDVNTSAVASPGEGRPGTARDSISVRYFSPEAAVVSADGQKVVIRSFHGDLSCDCNVVELQVFRAADVKRALLVSTSGRQSEPQPMRELTTRSSMDAPQWEADSTSISFDGTDAAGLKQVFKLNTVSGVVSQETHWPLGISF